MLERILITGGAGFIGSSLVSSLMRSKNYHLIVLDNLSSGTEDNISFWNGHANFKFVYADMLDPISLMKVVDSSDIVFHLTANPLVSLGSKDTKTDYEQNLHATYNLLEALRRSKSCKKMIFASSGVVYGEATIKPTPENYSPLMPISLYGATKLSCESLISGYCHLFSLSATVVRLANVIGGLSTHGVIYDFVAKLNNNPRILEILGDGRQNKSYLYIEDCINALRLLLSKLGESELGVYNVGSVDTINVLSIAKIVVKELGLENVAFKFINNFEGRGWKGDVKEFLLDSSKLEALGWNAEYNSAEAVNRTARDYASKLINKQRLDRHTSLM